MASCAIRDPSCSLLAALKMLSLASLVFRLPLRKNRWFRWIVLRFDRILYIKIRRFGFIAPRLNLIALYDKSRRHR